LVKINWINDIDEDLIITYKVMADPSTRKELIKMVSKEKATKERHKEIINMKATTDIERAFKYYYINRTSFSGKMKKPYWGYRRKRSLPPERWHERINPCGKKLEHAKITCLDFEEVIKAPPQGDSVLIFLDPPYFMAKQENHYKHYFKKEDHFRLEKLLRKTNFKFILTYDDCDTIRNLYDWAEIHPIQFFYRLDDASHSNGRRKRGNELIITNYHMPKIKKIDEFYGG